MSSGLAMTLSCCTGGQREIAVPRPAAYHRIAIPAPAYRTVRAGTVSIQLNTSVTDTVVSAGNSWVTACYPGLGTSMYITVTEIDPGTAGEAIDNRVERLSLNTGGLPTEVISFTTPEAFDAQLIITPAGSPIPVQFLATDHSSVLVSGTAAVEGSASSPADSISPVLEMLERDITHMLKTLKKQ